MPKRSLWIVDSTHWKNVYGPFRTPREAGAFAGQTGGYITEIENNDAVDPVVVKLATHIGNKPIRHPREFRGEN
jgi:hypothetical protein